MSNADEARAELEAERAHGFSLGKLVELFRAVIQQLRFRRKYGKTYRGNQLRGAGSGAGTQERLPKHRAE
jgi:hypothetical protein